MLCCSEPRKSQAGEMAEWLKAHAWKACIGETLSRVRIPVSPPRLRHDFEDRSPAVLAAPGSRTVKVARRVHRHTRVRIRTVRSVCETVEGGQRASRIQFK